MCGFTGFWLNSSKSNQVDRPSSTLSAMGRQIRHRGPDDHQIWWNEKDRIGFAHQRLSILDLSPNGRQPMKSASGRWIIAYNGETYNFQNLQKELETEGRSFRGHSDTEVLVEALDVWGIEKTLKRSVGMLSFAAWDDVDKKLVLARDRIGEKPLYYGWGGKHLIFGSEIKSFYPFLDWAPEIDVQALGNFTSFNYIPAPRTIFKSLYKLIPGTYLEISRSDFLSGRIPEPSPYWSLSDAASSSLKENLSAEDYRSEVRRTLMESVKEKMISDVPLGAFLSGGIDSSLIVSLMQAQSAQKIKTFTIGFSEKDFDESFYARSVAKHLGTDHTEMFVTPQDCLSVVPRLSTIYDEPFADSSQIPTFLVSQIARQKVTVSLSGDGGDEVFCGYERYLRMRQILNSFSSSPRWMRTILAGTMKTVPVSAWNAAYSVARPLLPGRFKRINRVGDKVHKLAGTLVQCRASDVYLDLVRHWKDPKSLVHGYDDKADERVYSIISKWLLDNASEGLELEEQLMLTDTLTYLPDDILVKVDRAAMAVSLESRAPFLDHRVIEAAWKAPLETRFSGGKGKRVLREILSEYVPEGLYERPKMGFAIPIDSWLRNELAEWADGLLSRERLKKEGFFSDLAVDEIWQKHRVQGQNWGYWIWDILMFQSWFETHQSQMNARKSLLVEESRKNVAEMVKV